jgi:hypothetical protein
VPSEIETDTLFTDAHIYQKDNIMFFNDSKEMRLASITNLEQLDEFAQQTNQAYTNQFDFSVSAKRSNKLRDCACDTLGFKDGVQAIKAYWKDISSYDFGDLNKITLFSRPHRNPDLAMSMFVAIAKPFEEIFNTVMLNNISTTFNLKSNDDICAQAPNDACDSWAERYKKENSNFHFILCDGVPIGVTPSAEWALLLSASMSNSNPDIFKKGVCHLLFTLGNDKGDVNDWVRYANYHLKNKPSFIHKARGYVVVKPFETAVPHFDMSLIDRNGTYDILFGRVNIIGKQIDIPFDAITISGNEVRIHYGLESIVISPETHNFSNHSIAECCGMKVSSIVEIIWMVDDGVINMHQTDEDGNQNELPSLSHPVKGVVLDCANLANLMNDNPVHEMVVRSKGSSKQTRTLSLSMTPNDDNDLIDWEKDIARGDVSRSYHL